MKLALFSVAISLCFFIGVQGQQYFLAPNGIAYQVTPLPSTFYDGTDATKPAISQAEQLDVSIENGIIVGTESNLDEVLEAYSKVVLTLYVSGCHYFNEFLPILEGMALKLEALGITLVKAEVSENMSLISEFSMKYSPTILGIMEGHVLEEFWDDRTADNFVEWAGSVFQDEQVKSLTIDKKTESHY